MDEYRMTPSSRPVNAIVSVPGSKSITNRAMLTAALSGGTSVLTGALDSEDTRIMAEALKLAGFQVAGEPFSERLAISPNKDSQIRSAPEAGVNPVELYVGNSGTTARFLAAALAFKPGYWRIDGKERMRQRPIGDLLDALAQLGADAKSEPGTGCPPVTIHGHGLPGGIARVRGDISSQFLSGLLMAAPLAEGNVRIEVEGELVSRPYVGMTLAVMKSFGVDVETLDDGAFFIPASARYQAVEYAVEPDASAASYLFALPAVVGGRVTVRGMTERSLQGDVGFVNLLEMMGCKVKRGEDGTTVIRDVQNGVPVELHGIDVDMNSISDTVQTLSVVALFASSPTRIRNVAHARRKETDRIAAAVTELRKFGARVEEYEDGMEIFPIPREQMTGARIRTYDDHRMAMSFALAGLAVPGVVIENPACTAKTYPRYFEDLESALRQ